MAVRFRECALMVDFPAILDFEAKGDVKGPSRKVLIRAHSYVFFGVIFIMLDFIWWAS